MKSRPKIVVAQWVRAALESSGMTQVQLTQEMVAANVINNDRSIISKMIRGERDVSLEEALEIARITSSPLPRAERVRPASIGPQVGVPEHDIRLGAGGGGIVTLDPESPESDEAVIARWGIPDAFARGELRAPLARLRIAQVLGDSMTPTLQSGDRVIIDTGHRHPSPPGIYAVWDGVGLVVKRIELVPASDPPRIRVISDNPHHSPYELAADEAGIVGRVVGRISVM